jgi:hypothetical protein
MKIKILKGQEVCAAYALRNIPLELWKSAKRKAAEENTSIRQIILDSLNAYLNPT